MAYINLDGKALTTKELTSLEIIGQMVSMGWSIYDDQSGSYYKILRSNGEDGTKQWLYAKIGWSGTNVAIDVYGFWNSTTHTTTAPTLNVHSGIYPDRNLWMFGNKDFVAIVQDAAGAYSAACMFGHIVAPPATSVNTTTTSAISAGASVVIPVTSNVGFVSGARYQIFDPSTGYKQTFLCTAVGTGTITAETISSVGYASSSVVGTHPMPIFVGSSVLVPGSSMNHHRATYSSTTGTLNMVVTSSDITYKATSLPYVGTPAKRAFFPPVAIETGTSPVSYNVIGTMDDGNGYFYICPHIETGNANDSYTAANFDAIYMGSNDTGTTTGSNTVTTMNDTSKSWATNQWAGKVLVVTSGPEIGQVRKIVSNTATQITVAVNFKVIPVSGTYVIADRGYRYFYPSYGFLFREGV